MSVQPVLWLTRDEQKLYEKLIRKIDALRAVVEEERSQNFETDVQLQKRALEMQKHASPLAKLSAKHVFGKIRTLGIDAVSSADFSVALLPQLLLTIGARGITAIVSQFLPAVQTADDLASVSYLTTVRHRILLTNHLLD